MTAKEMFEKKYREKLASIRNREREYVKEIAEFKKISPAQVMFMGLEITEHDIKANGGWGGELYNDLTQLHAQKLIASNKHRQEHGHVDRYWLTKKGYKKLFAE